MKKSFSILLLILSFGFITNVNAGEYIIESTKPFKAPLITNVYKNYNKYYFYNAHVLGWGDMLITYEDGKGLKRLNDSIFTDIIFYDDYYFISSYEMIYKFNKDDTLIKSYTLENAHNTTYLMEMGDNLVVYSCSYPEDECEYTVLDRNLNYIKTVEPNGYDVMFYMRGINNKIIAHSEDKIYAINDKYEIINTFTLDDYNYRDSRVDSLEIIDDAAYVMYTTGESNKYTYLYKLDLTGNLLWKKKFKSSIYNYYTRRSNIRKLSNGNYLYGNGSLYEIDNDGNVINSCEKCTSVFGTYEENGKIYTVGDDFSKYYLPSDEGYYYDVPSVFNELKIKRDIKLTIKDSANGRVRVNREKPHSGQEVVVTLRPEVGYIMDELVVKTKSGKKLELKKITDKKYSFVMEDEDTSIEVTYKKK